MRDDAAVDEPAHPVHLLRDRDDRVWEVDLVQVDDVDAESLRTRAPVPFDDRCERHDRQQLRCDEDLLAAPGDRTTDDAFRFVAPVDLGGVDQVHAEIERPVDDRAGLVLRVVGAVAPVLRSELPRAQPDHRQPDTIDFDVSHARSVTP